MYKNFFGFKERPFQLVPNPAYLFLSRSHEEAIAHLSYAVSQGDGFVELTGEVGTGKTTLCRAFLENLDENTEAAYIFNPKLDAIQLLKTINDEFGISSDGDNIKDLIDTLNAFLMEKKSEGRKVILVIDEAQNLSKEVLEQLRLLSNLETTTSKLLQIILVGQPELGEMLDSQDLRQLGQRITLSCHLNPLTFKETREYVRHRIHVASQKSAVKFTWPALGAIYKYSGGIPRLINIACDRALLTAFGLNQKKITGSIARASVRELAGRGDVKRFSLQYGRKGTLFVALLCLAVFLIILYHPGDVNINSLFTIGENGKLSEKQDTQGKTKSAATSPSDRAPAKEQRKSPPVDEPAKMDQTADKSLMKTVEDLGSFLESLKPRPSRSGALKAAMNLWNPGSRVNPYLETMDDDQVFFRSAAKQNGLLVHRVDADLSLLEKLNLPAVLAFRLRGSQSPRYLTLTRIDEKEIILKGGEADEAFRVQPTQLKSYWTQVAYVPWKDFLDYAGVIPFNAPRESIITLKMLMQDIGFSDIEISPSYDEKTREAVKAVQEKHGIRVDGVVGPLTKMVLYNEKKGLKVPHLKAER
jgi:general secretion pathway protein A